jgi:hypothetical protein
MAYIRDSWSGSPRGAMHAAVAATPALAFQMVTASPGVCCAVNASGIASETKTIAFVINVNFLDFMEASSVEAGGSL